MTATTKGTRYEARADHPYDSREGTKWTVFPSGDEELRTILREAAIHWAIAGYYEDPNRRYVAAVARDMLDQLRERKAIMGDEYDILDEALDRISEDAAVFVAKKWLRERGAVPVPAD